MIDNEIPAAEIYLSVPGQPGAHAPFADFIEACSALRSTLRHVERCVTGKKPSLELEVTELEHSSGRVRTSPRIRDAKDRATSRDTFRVHRDTVRSLQAGDKSLDPRLDYAAVYSFSEFAPPVKRGRSAVAVTGTTLSSVFLETLEKVLEPVGPALGSVGGVVEQLDVHGKHTFVLFPPVPGNEVKCSFRPEDFEKVRAAVNRNVTVYGLLHYGRGQSFPVKAIMDDIEIEPDDSDLPDLLDMEGMLEGEGIGESTHVIRSLRDEWQ